MKHFWMGFEKSAMTNKKILKQYFSSLLNTLRRSPDATDKAIYNYVMKDPKSLTSNVLKSLREKGESPTLNWKHNIHPKEMRDLVHEGKVLRSKPGYARSVVLKFMRA